MVLNLLEKGSIILNIGDIKLSNTEDTFGKSNVLNGYAYSPLMNDSSNLFVNKQIIANIAYGDHKRGATISNGNTSVVFAYGANRPTSNAQSMAIGYYDGEKYFFIVESFGDIYAEKRGVKPELVARRIVSCYSLWNHDETQKDILYNGELQEKPDDDNMYSFIKLMDRVKVLEPAFRVENLNMLKNTKNNSRSSYSR